MLIFWAASPFFPLTASAQDFGVGTNILYWGTATLNTTIEVALSQKYTLSATVGYNPFNFPDRTGPDGTSINPKLHHWLVMPEGKYWFCKAFERHYMGLHALYTQYNIGGIGLSPCLMDGRYRGWAVGAGLSYGYQWALGKRWGLEASLGLGYVYLRYGRFDCGACGDMTGEYARHWFGPTKAAVSFIYYIR